MKGPFVQGRMDDVASPSTLCGRKNGQLKTGGSIACDKQPGNAAGLKIIAADRLCPVQLCAQLLGECRVLKLASIEEEGLAGEVAAIGKNQALEMIGIPCELADGSFFHLDAMDGQAAELVCTQFGRSIATERDVSCPGQHFERVIAGSLAFPISHPGPPLMFPSIAVGTMEDAAAVIFTGTWNIGQHIDFSGRQQQDLGSNAGAAGQTDLEAPFDMTCINCLLGLEPDAGITPQFLPRDPPEFLGCNSIPTEEPVDGFGRGIARFSRVTEKDAAPATPQEKSRGQTGGSSPDNADVVNFLGHG
jgi:hypothetical protein